MIARAFALAAALWLAAGLAAAAPPWPPVPYSYQADHQPVAQAIAEVARHFGLTARVTDDVEGMVNGRISAPTPTDFMNRLGNMFGLSWFTYGGTLYVTRSSNFVTRSLSLPSTEPGTMRRALADLGLFEPRFGWAELPERGAALVSGPPEYVELVAKVLAALPTVPADQNVAVFRLKHAPVDDRVIALRDKQVTTPGVATILRNLVTGNVTDIGTRTLLVEMSAPLRNAPSALAAEEAAGVDARTPANPAVRDVAGRRRPVIQSDPRLNAIIVRDTPDRIPIYEKLIQFLDQPGALIEIQAHIIDINNTKLDELGIDWVAQWTTGSGNTASAGFGNPNVQQDSNTFQATRNVNPSTLVVTGNNFLIAKVKLLESKGDGRLQSRPSILTFDNIGAVIDLAETFYVRVTGERVANVVPITAATTLRVTPRFVDRDGHRLVQLTVDIQDSNIEEQRTVDTLPTIRTSTVSTEAVVAESQSLLIAGYSTDQRISQDDAVPLLGRVPLLGMLFRHTSDNRQRRERMFLITPKIVAMPYEVPAGAEIPPPPSGLPPKPVVAPASLPAPPAAASSGA